MALRRRMPRRYYGLLRWPAQTLSAYIHHTSHMLIDMVGRTLSKSAHHQCWQHALQVLGPTAKYYGLWPVDHLSAPWNLLAEAVYQQVIEHYLPAGCCVVAVALFY
jgi:hypothetical protein